MKPFRLMLIIFFLLSTSVSADGQSTNDTVNLKAIKDRIEQYEEIMHRYFRTGLMTAAQNSYRSKVDKYNKSVQTTNAMSAKRKSEIDQKEKALEKQKEKILKYDAQLAEKFNRRLIDRRNSLVEQYNNQLEKLEDEITKYNEWIKQADQNLDTEKARIEKLKTALELKIKQYNDWFRLNKDEEFWMDLNRTFLNLLRIKRAGNDDPQVDKQIKKIRNLRKELGTYAVNEARSNESGLVIISAIVSRKEEVHFIVDTGAKYVSLMPEMIEVLGLKDRLGEVTDLTLAAGKTAWGQKIIFPYISVLGMEEQGVPGISIPERSVGTDGLLGRSFLKHFVVCFDYEQGPKIRLTHKKP